MHYWKRGALVVLGAIALSGLMLPSALAKPGNGHGQGQSHRPSQTTATETEAETGGHGHGQSHRPSQPNSTEAEDEAEDMAPTTTATPNQPLTAEQQQALTDMILGHGSNSELISDSMRSDILANLSSLPPGIQRRLLRGRSLPPGIAKKFSLPATVPAAANLPSNYQVVVAGSNVLVLDPVTQQIIDVIANAL